MARPLATKPAIKPTLRGNKLYVQYFFRKLMIRKSTGETAEPNQIGTTGYLKSNHSNHITINQKLEAIAERLEVATAIVLKKGDAAVSVEAIEAEYDRLTKEAQWLEELPAQQQSEKETTYLHKLATSLETLETYSVDTEIEELERKLAEARLAKDNILRVYDKYEDDLVTTFLKLYSTRKGEDTTMSDSSKRSIKSLITTLNDFNASWKVQDVTEQTLIDFQSFLVKRKAKNSTIENYTTKIKTMLNYYSDRPKLLPSHVVLTKDYKNYSCELVQKPEQIIALSKEEIDTLMLFGASGNYKKKSWAKIIDVFCLMCATGLRVSDVTKIHPTFIKNGFIEMTPKKTKRKQVQVRIPLNPYSAYILQKYQFDMTTMKIEDYYVNEQIKVICKLLGGSFNIKETVVNYSGATELKEVKHRHELISNHSGRRTYSTLAIQAGTNIPTIMQHTGHTNPKTLMLYVNKLAADTGAMSAVYQLPESLTIQQS